MEIDLEAEISKTARLGSCEVCSENQSKYTCPRCELKTCSLKCSKIHKTELECDGMRDRTKYKPLKQMTPMDFMNDYYFLEEATRFTKEIKCNKNVKSVNRVNMRFTRLKKEASSRNIKLYYVNSGLTKRKRNKSSFRAQTKTIAWYVELVFPNASNFVRRKKFDETTKVRDILQDIFDENDKQLDFYRAEGANKLRVLLKAEGLKNSSNRFYEMNLNKTLNSNLKGKIIIEFPTLLVVMSHSADGFDVIPSDDESLDVEMKNFSQTLHEEVFSQKVGINPPLVLKPEEVPIISEVIDDKSDTKVAPSRAFVSPVKRQVKHETNDSDEEVQPANYLFSNDS